MAFEGFDIRFTVEKNVLYVKDIVKCDRKDYTKIK